jgi:hypothetical protein
MMNMNSNTQLSTFNRLLTSMAEDTPDWHLYKRLLHHGRSFAQAASEPKEVVRGVQGLCFANCQMALHALEDMYPGQYRYAEGYAAAADALNVPIHHAWLVDAAGKAVDCTWETQAVASYFGFTFATRHVLSESGRKLGDPLFQDLVVLSACFSHPRRRRPSPYPLVEELASLENLSP